jgi:hypothetical protein
LSVCEEKKKIREWNSFTKLLACGTARGCIIFYFFHLHLFAPKVWYSLFSYEYVKFLKFFLSSTRNINRRNTTNEKKSNVRQMWNGMLHLHKFVALKIYFLMSIIISFRTRNAENTLWSHHYLNFEITQMKFLQSLHSSIRTLETISFKF